MSPMKPLALLGAAGVVAGAAAPALAAPASSSLRGHVMPLADRAHDRLVRRYRRLARHPDPTARQWTDLRLRRAIARLTAASAASASSSTGSVASPQLQAIAACESGGNPHAIGGGGQFRGKYQFTYATWAAVGGTGDPAAAPEAEQDRRAAILLATAGPGNWPVCSR